MATGKKIVGWIGTGRMGFPMAERLLAAGHDVRIWNRTRDKAAGLEKVGGTLVDKASDLASVEILFTMISTGKVLDEVLFGASGVAAGGKGKMPPIVVDCSTIGIDESAAIRAKLKEMGTEFVAAPVSGNANVLRAKKLSSVISGPEKASREVEPLIALFSDRGTSYVGEGELARVVKIAHNVFLAATFASLTEITILAQKAGVPRHAFLAFINASVMGSTFSGYKTPALVNADWTPTFTPDLLRKDLDLGLELGDHFAAGMPITAAVREQLHAYMGTTHALPQFKDYVKKDFAALAEYVALAAGIELKSENKKVPSGLET
jgi:3-hydroxyisobutyrate dehydrogenase